MRKPTIATGLLMRDDGNGNASMQPVEIVEFYMSRTASAEYAGIRYDKGGTLHVRKAKIWNVQYLMPVCKRVRRKNPAT